MNARTGGSGFTLVELMVTVAIVALLLKFVGWGLAGVTSYEDVRMAARGLETAVQEAKTLAYEKGAVHSLIFSCPQVEATDFFATITQTATTPSQPTETAVAKAMSPGCEVWNFLPGFP